MSAISTLNEDGPEAARRLVQQGRYHLALHHLREHLMRCPRDPHALHHAGTILQCLGRYDEAARHLERALQYLTAESPDAC